MSFICFLKLIIFTEESRACQVSNSLTEEAAMPEKEEEDNTVSL